MSFRPLMGIILFNNAISIGLSFVTFKPCFRPLMGIILFNMAKASVQAGATLEKFPSPNGDYFI